MNPREECNMAGLQNAIRIELPKTIAELKQTSAQFELNIRNLQIAIEDYTVIEALRLDKESPTNQRVFSSADRTQILQKVKTKWIASNYPNQKR